MMGMYKLVDKVPVKVEDIIEWAQEFSKDRVVKQEHIGEIFISTIFLGLDHSFCDSERPLLFETMIFGGEHDQYQERYKTWDDAITGHELACSMVKPKLLNNDERSDTEKDN